MERKSVWMQAHNKISFPKLTQDNEVDIAIIGGGITGITLAFELLTSGKKVAIYEADEIAKGTTGFSTANLYAPVMHSHQAIQEKFNKAAINTLLHSRRAALDYIERTVAYLNIDCHFRRKPLYIFTNENKKIPFLTREEAIFQEAGLHIQSEAAMPLPVDAKKIIKLDNQARFNPFLYAVSLAEHLKQYGCEIYENTPIASIEEKKDIAIAKTPIAKITAKKIVMATHVPKGFNMSQMLVFPYRSYAVGALMKNNIYPLSQYWDIDHSISISTHNLFSQEADLLLLAGNYHKVGQSKWPSYSKNYSILEQYANNKIGPLNFDYRWSAQHYQSADLLPYIGLASRFSKHLYMATGYATDGLIYGTLAGIILADLLQDKDNPWLDIYDANRFKPFAAAPKILKENINVVCQYLQDYPGNVDAKHEKEIKANEGKVIEIHGEKCAAYRDSNNKLHIVSAVCPHMACIVKWNSAEKSWDCPCHGSRFAIDGSVIEGPALTSLKPIKMEEK